MPPQDASFIPPDVMPPDPPEVKAVVLVVSVCMSVILIAFIGFVSVEFLADMAGHPLNFGRSPRSSDVLLSLDADGTEESPISSGLITPKHQTILMGPEVVVLYKRRLPNPAVIPPNLVVDNARHLWEAQYGDNIWFVRLSLLPGLHRVQVEESEAEFFVETLTSPVRSMEQWQWHRPHPDTNKLDQCSDCHEMLEQPTDPLTMSMLGDHRQAVGAWKGIASCFECHDEDQQGIKHTVIQMVPTDQCLWCHAMH